MLLERRHAADDAVVGEGRHPPLEGLLDLGIRLVHQLADVLQDRLGEVRGLSDISVDAWVFLAHGSAPSSIPGGDDTRVLHHEDDGTLRGAGAVDNPFRYREALTRFQFYRTTLQIDDEQSLDTIEELASL